MVARDAQGAVEREPPSRPWSLSAREVLEALGADPERGLDAEEVRRRRKRFGPNRLRRAEAKSAWVILAYQLRSLMVYLLAAAMGVSFLFGQWVEGLAIGAVILLNAAIGFVTELRAVRSMEALYRLGRVEARVLREGAAREVPAEQLVPGDIVLLEGGDIATADLRLVEASKLQVDESALTGESLPVGKGVDPLAEDAPLHDRKNMVFKGTAVSRGSGLAVVVATGMETELGRIASLVEEGEEETTPLEKRLDALSRRLVWVTLALAALIGSTGILAGRELFLMIETSIALAVAAVPEGLPIVATIALARGMWRMAERNALVSRLSAVETLGATTVILTDKTGTLTENLMTVVRVVVGSSEFEVTGRGLQRQGEFLRRGEPVGPHEDPLLAEALEVGALCNNASFQDGADGGEKPLGDPLEVALLVAAAKAGLSRGELTEKMPEVREEAFDPETKLMATFHRGGEGSWRVAVKGAPEAVLAASGRLKTSGGERPLSEEDRRGWMEANRRMAEEGLRVVAVATKEVDDAGAEPYRDLAFVGLLGMLDPPRAEVRRALERCRHAGLRVVMVTGDQAATAGNVARAVGLLDEGGEPEVVRSRDLGRLEELAEGERQRLLRAPIFARVTPEQKLYLVGLHQSGGEVVAMTGDGVNDAPALKKADIGVAMGQRGTQVAREAADMILKDDAFSTIVTAVEGGRVIFDNIRKFVLYLLSCNVSEIMAVALASALGAPLPVLPLQILFLNLVTDVFPALALGLGEGDPAVMERPPRDPSEPILTTRHWAAVGGYGALITAAVLGALALALLWLKMEQGQAVTVSFLTLAFAQLWHVFNMRDSGSEFLRNEITRNAFVWGALGLCGVLLLVAVYVPVLAVVLKVEDPGARGWALVLAMSLLPWAAGQGLKLAASRG